MRAVYQKMGDALLATGRPMVFSLCQVPKRRLVEMGPQVGGNLWRTTGDITDTGSAWRQLASAIRIAGYARSGHWNDPDMLEVGNGGMSADEYRVHEACGPCWPLHCSPEMISARWTTSPNRFCSIPK